MSHPTLPPLPARVAAGAALLDQREPGWHAHVGPDALGRYNPGRVLLDHLSARFYNDDLDAILAALSDTFTSPRDLGAHAWLVAHGFDLAAGEDARPQLAAWRQAISARRTCQAPTATARQRPSLDSGDELLATVRGLLAARELSLAAKAVLFVAATRPDGQVLARAELVESGRDARWQVDAALAELVEDGWLAPVDGGFVLRTDPDADGEVSS